MYIGCVNKDGTVIDEKTWNMSGRTLWDRDGNWLVANEKLLEQFSVCAGIKDNWELGGCLIFSHGDGTLYRSTKRLLFLREPSILGEIFYGKGALYQMPGNIITATTFKKRGIKEYFEIANREIVGYKGGGRFTVFRLCIISDGKKYGVWLTANNKIFSNFKKELKRIK